MSSLRAVTSPPPFDAWEVDLHGHRVVYRTAGSGPPVVLVHGMVNSSRHWQAVAQRLAEHHTVIAPDLVGHGDSATPRGDYSLGAHAAVIRDLLSALGIERASIVGHSLGGGIAMVFFWQFPERVERLALVSSGGLGEEVSPMLRSAALPGVKALISLAAHRHVTGGLGATGRLLQRRGSGLGVQLQAVARALRPLETPGAREAFLQTLRAVIDRQGQRVNANDRLYLLEAVPTLVVWGERDRTIPIEHGEAAHRAIPHSRFVRLPRSAHFPHLEDPEGLADALREFLATTQPAQLDEDAWRALLRDRPRALPRPRVVAG
ncbi:alpha/beta fold hydrolase [Conexibacter sp. SYSU D00693]|uniref:alpha/beta fold hydrolase n=1 Tax=Conexibacter sp. SYSU D00693 TaxID=2812560 RepID=UPI00196AF678|nr:alpha/beta fold hydrolase [Conexibacter sp. SYSU D00693]